MNILELFWNKPLWLVATAIFVTLLYSVKYVDSITLAIAIWIGRFTLSMCLGLLAASFLAAFAWLRGQPFEGLWRYGRLTLQVAVIFSLFSVFFSLGTSVPDWLAASL